MKNVLRLYLQFPATEEFFDDPDDIIKFKEKYAIFREGRRQVKAGKLGLQKKYAPRKRKEAAVKEEKNSAPVIKEAQVPAATAVPDDDVIQPPDAALYEADTKLMEGEIGNERPDPDKHQSADSGLEDQEADELTAMFLNL